MRWFWIDRFTEFVSGKYARAVKGVTLAEEAVDEYVPGATFLPAPLIIESFAQMGGLLVGQTSDFLERVVLAKVNRADFFDEARPGDLIQFRAEIASLQAIGGAVRGTAHVDEKPLCEVDLTFAFLNTDRFVNQQLFEPAGFLRMLRLLRLFDVGRTADGQAISVPEHLLAAERAIGLAV
jgi:3-hydroxyacyl-[acyl-carrier-protein] dehydratase